MGSVKEEITRLETAKKDIETAIETCGVNVPDTELIDTYALYIRQIPSAVFSGLNVDPVGGADQFIQSIKQTNGLIEATVGGLVSTSNSGLVPKADGNAGTINNQSDDYVLTYKGGTIDWYKLPANAFKNDDNNTTYTLSGTLNGNAYDVTLTPSSGNATGAKVPAMGAASSSTAGTAGLVPAPAKNQHNSFLRGDGTWVVPDNTTYSVMTGATASAAGKSGLVPQPAKGDQGKFLSGAGTWTSLPSLSITDSESGNAVTDVEVSGHGITLKRGTTFSVNGHKHSSEDITALTNYIKATTATAIASTDSLNSALGKLEYKADLGKTAYDIVNAANDGDGTIENLTEILKVLEGIKDTETIQAIIGKYLPLSGGVMTGALDLTNSPNTADGYKMGVSNSGHLGGGIHFKKNGVNDWGQAITWSLGDKNSHAGIYVKSSGAYGTKMYLCTTDLFVDGSKAALEIDHTGKITALRNNFVGNLTGNASTASSATIAGDGTMTIVPKYNNEINFGGTNASSTLYFGYRATESKPIPTAFIFGGSSGSASITAAKFIKSGGTSSQFLKADGSVDSNTYLTSLPSHTHDYIPFEQSVNGKDMNTIKTTGFYYGYTMTNSADTNISSFIVAKYSPDWGSQIQLCSSSSRAYIRYWQNAGGVMGTWKTLAYTSDIPTNNNQLTNGAGYVTSSGVTKVSTGTGLTGGDITSTGTISIDSTYQTYISNGNTAYGWGNHASAGYINSSPNSLEMTGVSNQKTPFIDFHHYDTVSNDYDYRIICDVKGTAGTVGKGTCKFEGTSNFKGDILTNNNNTYNLGSSSKVWKNVYATTFNGTATALLNFTTKRGETDGAVDCNAVTSNGMWYWGSNGPSTTIGADYTDGALYSIAYSNSWVAQISQGFRNGELFTRARNNGTWTSWRRLAYADGIGNGTVTVNQNSSSKGSFTLNQAGNATINLTDYYPTAFTWTAGTTAGPTGSLTGVGMSAVSFAAIPSASQTASGIVTTGAQTFAGQKTFYNGIRVGSSATQHSTDATKVYFGDSTFVWIGESDEDDALTIYGKDYVHIRTALNTQTYISSSTSYPGVICDSMYLKSAAYHIGTVTKLQPETATTTVTTGYGIPGVTIAQGKTRGGKRTITITNTSGFRIYVHAPHVSALFLDKGEGSCIEHGFAYIQSGVSFPYSLSTGNSVSFYVIYGYVHTQGSWNTGDFTKSNDLGGFTCSVYASRYL